MSFRYYTFHLHFHLVLSNNRLFCPLLVSFDLSHVVTLLIVPSTILIVVFSHIFHVSCLNSLLIIHWLLVGFHLIWIFMESCICCTWRVSSYKVYFYFILFYFILFYSNWSFPSSSFLFYLWFWFILTPCLTSNMSLTLCLTTAWALHCVFEFYPAFHHLLYNSQGCTPSYITNIVLTINYLTHTVDIPSSQSFQSYVVHRGHIWPSSTLCIIDIMHCWCPIHLSIPRHSPSYIILQHLIQSLTVSHASLIPHLAFPWSCMCHWCYIWSFPILHSLLMSYLLATSHILLMPHLAFLYFA